MQGSCVPWLLTDGQGWISLLSSIRDAQQRQLLIKVVWKYLYTVYFPRRLKIDTFAATGSLFQTEIKLILMNLYWKAGTANSIANSNFMWSIRQKSILRLELVSIEPNFSTEPTNRYSFLPLQAYYLKQVVEHSMTTAQACLHKTITGCCTSLY